MDPQLGAGRPDGGAAGRRWPTASEGSEPSLVGPVRGGGRRRRRRRAKGGGFLVLCGGERMEVEGEKVVAWACDAEGAGDGERRERTAAAAAGG